MFSTWVVIILYRRGGVQVLEWERVESYIIEQPELPDQCLSVPLSSPSTTGREQVTLPVRRSLRS